MLQSIHDNAKGWVAYLIVILISVPFALWGIQEYLGTDGKNTIAEVNGEEIDLRTLQNEVATQRQRMTQMFGQLPPGFEDSALKSSALESLITGMLLSQHAAEQGYRASPQEVLNLLKDIPQFQRDGQFDAEIYRQAVALRGQSAAGFEEQLRRSLSEEQFTNAIAQSAFLPRDEMERYQSLSNQKRDIETYTLKVEDVLQGITVSDEQIKAYYDANPDQFQTDEQVKLAYVELSESELSKTIELSDDDLLTYYNENSDRYLTPAKYRASRIRVNITEQQNEEQAKAKADSLFAELNSGAKTFEVLQKDNQDETIFVESGEGLPFINKGTMSAEVEDMILAAKAGDILQPMLNAEAYEIIKVLDVASEQQQSFEEAKVSIEKDLRKEKSAARYEDLFELLRTTAFENDGSLEPSATAVGGEIKTTDFFSRAGGKAIAANPEIIKAAFSTEVVDQGRNSSLIELPGNKAVVVRMDAHKSPSLKPLADVKAEIETQLKKEEAKKQLKDKAEAILAAVKQSGDWSSLGDQTAAVEKHAELTRTATTLPTYILTQAFKTPVGNDKPGYAVVEAPSGDFTVVAVTAMMDGDKAIDEVAEEQYASYIGNRMQSAALKALREKADIKIYTERLNSEE